MNGQSRAGVFEDIATRILRAVSELREAVANGTAADPGAATALADQMEGYADSVLKGEHAPSRGLATRERG